MTSRSSLRMVDAGALAASLEELHGRGACFSCAKLHFCSPWVGMIIVLIGKTQSEICQ